MINKGIKNYLFPIHALSNIECDMYFRDIGLKKQALKTQPKDLLGKTFKKDTFQVVNLDDNDGLGTHWTCICNSSREDGVLYYDSYGVKYLPIEIEEFLKTSKKPIYVNDGQHQFIGSVLCGYYCLKIIKSIFLDKMTYEEAINQFNDNPNLKNMDIADNLFI